MPTAAKNNAVGPETRDVRGIGVSDEHEHQQAVDSEHHAVCGQPGQRRGHRRHCRDGAGAVHPPGGHRIDDRPVDRALAVVGTEQVRRKAPRQPQRERNRDRDEKDDCCGADVVGAEQPAGHQHEDGAEERGGPARRGRDRVHRHHLVAWHHVRQRRRQAGRDEAGEPVDDQRGDQDRQIVCADREQHGDDEHHQQAPDVGADEHQASVPPVQQRAGERAEQRVRQIEHGERAGDGPRRRGPFGAEQQPARQARGEQAVTELTDECEVRAAAETRAGRAPIATGRAAHVRRPRKSRPVASRGGLRRSMFGCPRSTVQISPRPRFVRHDGRLLMR